MRMSLATLIGTLLVLILRLAGMRWQLSLPVFQPHANETSANQNK